VDVRVLEVVRQAYVHDEVVDGVLHSSRSLHDAHGMADRLDPDLVDGELARIVARLNVRDIVQVASFHRLQFNIRVNHSDIAFVMEARMPSASSPTDASNRAGSP